MEAGQAYAALAAPLPEQGVDPRGNAFLPVGAVIKRLNESLGIDSWSFTIVSHGINDEANEVWVLGDLAIVTPAGTMHHQQFGGCKIKRFRETKAPMDLSNDLQGAASDCLKKCASHIGISVERTGAPRSQPVAGGELRCEECNDALTGVRFKDGTEWTAQQLAAKGRQKYRQVRCRTHYFTAA